MGLVSDFGLAKESLNLDLQRGMLCYGRLCMTSSAFRCSHDVYKWDAALAVPSLCGFYLPTNKHKGGYPPSYASLEMSFKCLSLELT